MHRHKRSSRQFLEAQMSSLIATASDFLVTALLFRIAGLNHILSTFSGAVCGGIVNCSMNYRWVFSGTSRTKRGVALRYAIVWGGSILLNTWGVALAVALLKPYYGLDLSMLMNIKMAVALIVAFCWNFVLQKRWVFK